MYGEIRPALADQLLAAGAGQCWVSPQEMAAAARGDYPHGFIDETWPGEYRIWNDRAAVWLNV